MFSRRILLILGVAALAGLLIGATDFNDSHVSKVIFDYDSTADSTTITKRGVDLLELHQDTGATLFKSGPWFTVDFNEGAAKGVALYTPLSAAYSTTADAVNILAYGHAAKFHFVTNTTATGTITPAGTATGLDLNAGSPGNSDEWTMTAGVGDAVGGQIIPGTTPAWKACLTANVTDVSEAAGFWLLVTSVGPHVDLDSADPNYTSYAGIGIEQTDFVVSDKTDGAVDTTEDAADATEFEMCVYGSLGGVITYYLDSSQVAAAATHTLGDGVPHVVRVQGLNHTGTEAPMNAVKFSLLPQ